MDKKEQAISRCANFIINELVNSELFVRYMNEYLECQHEDFTDLEFMSESRNDLETFIKSKLAEY